jgi:hypothetical protein
VDWTVVTDVVTLPFVAADVSAEEAFGSAMSTTIEYSNVTLSSTIGEGKIKGSTSSCSPTISWHFRWHEGRPGPLAV